MQRFFKSDNSWFNHVNWFPYHGCLNIRVGFKYHTYDYREKQLLYLYLVLYLRSILDFSPFRVVHFNLVSILLYFYIIFIVGFLQRKAKWSSTLNKIIYYLLTNTCTSKKLVLKS